MGAFSIPWRIEMGLRELQERLKAVLSNIDSEQDSAKLEEFIVEGNGIKTQIETAMKGEELKAWASKSTGMLPLVAPAKADVVAMTPAGATTIEATKRGWLVNSDGEGILPDGTMKTLRNPEYLRAFKTYIRKGIGKMSDSDGLKTLQEGLDESGGYLVPEDLLNQLIAKDPAATTVSGRVRRFTTGRDSVLIPKVTYSTDDIYTTGMRVTWGAESPDATSHRVTEPVFGMTRIPVYTAMLSLPLTNNMIEDSAFDIMGWCQSKFGETIQLLRDNMALNGSGSGEPTGILANPNATDNPATVATTVADAVSWEGVQNLVWALPDQYDARAVHVFNKASTGLALAKLVDGDGRPLWSLGTADTGMVGSPRQRQLMGYDAVYSAFMPDIAAGAYPMIFGDLTGYYSVDRVGMSIQVLREKYAEQNQVVILGRVRFGGLVAEPWRIKIAVVSA